MLFTWRFSETLQALLNDSRMEVVVIELLRAHRCGHHLVVPDRETVAMLRGLALSGADLSLLNRLESEFTQHGRLSDRASIYVDIMTTFDPVLVRVGAQIRISLGTLYNLRRILDPAVLLVEHVTNDGWVLEQAIKAVALQNGMMRPSFDKEHGGGDSIVSVLETKLETKKIYVALVDSDRDSPLCPQPSKVARLNGVFSEAQWPLGFAACLPCREIENLVPLDVISTIPSGHNNLTTDILRAIETAEETAGIPSHERFYSFVDLKLGNEALVSGRLDHVRAEWYRTKLRAAGLDDTKTAFCGYGTHIVAQLQDNGHCASRFVRALKTRLWQDLFADFFLECCWYFFAKGALRT